MCKLCEDPFNLEPPGVIYVASKEEINSLAHEYLEFKTLLILRKEINRTIICDCEEGKKFAKQKEMKDLLKNKTHFKHLTLQELREIIPNKDLVKLLKGEYIP